MVNIQWRSDNGIYLCTSEKNGFVLGAPIETSISSSVQTVRSPLADGGKTYNPVLDRMVVNLTLAAAIRGTRNVNAFIVKDDLKNIMAAAFSPNTYGNLVCYNYSGERFARCLSTKTPKIQKEMSNMVIFEIELVSDSPTWLGEQKETFIGRKNNLLVYPVILPQVFSEMISGVVVHNTSRAEAYPVYEVSSASSVFQVENQTTGKSFTINHAILAGEKAVIDTYERTVRLQNANGVMSDISHYMDGDFVTLAPGKNIFESYNNTAGAVPNCKMLWREPRMSV